MLAGLGVGKGDRVLIYMPMVPEAAIAMLACARIGAIHSVVFGGFAAHELATRIDDAKPKVIVSASCGIEVNRVVPYKPLLDAAIDEARAKPEHPASSCSGRCAVPSSIAGRDHDWNELAAAAARPIASRCWRPTRSTSSIPRARPAFPRAWCATPAAMPWRCTGRCANIYGFEPDEVFWTASDVGWVVGHSYIVYAPLIYGCTTVLYEGKPVGTPDAGAFWRVIAQHEVRVFFTAPTAFRAIKREDPEGSADPAHELGKFRALFLAGERADPPTVAWAEEQLKVPVIDHWWQTETGWPIGANCLGIERLPVKHGSATRPVPGWDIRVLDAEAEGEARRTAGGRDRRARGQIAAAARRAADPVAGRRPFRADRICRPIPGYYQTGDAGFIDADGYIQRDDPHRRHHQCRRRTDCRPAGWRRCWRRIPMSPNARSWASPTRSRARCRSGCWC